MFEIGEKTLRLALRDAEMAEVYIEREDAVELQVQRERIDFAKTETITGIGVRVIRDGRMGFAYTSTLRCG